MRFGVGALIVVAACRPGRPQVDQVPTPTAAMTADAGVADATPEVDAAVDAPEAEVVTRPAGDPRLIDLDDFGRDPGHRDPPPVPVAMTDDQRRTLAELDRLAQVHARGLPVEDLYRRLGGVRARVDGKVEITPEHPEIVAIAVREQPAPVWVELQLAHPVSVELLEARFGPFVSYLQGHRDGDQMLYATETPIDVGAGHGVLIVIALPDETVKENAYQWTAHAMLVRYESPSPPASRAKATTSRRRR